MKQKSICLFILALMIAQFSAASVMGYSDSPDPKSAQTPIDSQHSFYGVSSELTKISAKGEDGTYGSFEGGQYSGQILTLPNAKVHSSAKDLEGQVSGATDFSVTVEQPYRSDQNGNKIPESTIAEEYGTPVSDGTDLVVYRRYYYTTWITARTFAYINVRDASYDQPLMRDQRKNDWVAGYSAYDGVLGDYIEPTVYKTTLPKATVEKRTSAVDLTVDMNLRATYDESSFGSFTDATGNTYEQVGNWAGIFNVQAGTKIDGAVKIKDGFKDVYYDDTRAQEGSVTSKVTAYQGPLTYSESFSSGTVTSNIPDIVRTPSESRVADGERATVYESGGAQYGGGVSTVSNIRTDSGNHLKLNDAPQEKQIRMSFRIKPTFYYTRAAISYYETTVRFEYITGFLSYTINLKFDNNKIPSLVNIVGGNAINYFIQIPIIFSVIGGTDHRIILPPSAPDGSQPDIPSDVGSLQGEWVQDNVKALDFKDQTFSSLNLDPFAAFGPFSSLIWLGIIIGIIAVGYFVLRSFLGRGGRATNLNVNFQGGKPS